MNQFYTLLGLARKAGKLFSGQMAVETAIKKGTARLVIIAGDASDNTCERLASLANNNNLPFLVYGKKEEIGKAVGKNPRASVCISDRNFAQAIEHCLRVTPR
jgi:ribosomal protein L7Ae-like RNA K-turn-binding protein